MEAGAVNIKFMADILDVIAKTKAMEQAVSSTMGGIEKAVGIAKNALIGLIGITSVGAFAGMIKGSIDATGSLHDMAIQTGASEAALGAFRKMGAYTETSAESIAGAINKLSKNLINTSEDGKGAGVAIKALGLNFNDFTKLSPDQRMIQVAKAMDQFADGADKGAIAQLLFGKEGAKLLPFLKDLADGADDVNKVLTEEQVALKKTQAAMADAFGDNLTKIQKNSDEWKKDLATGMTPALYEATEAFISVTTGAGGFKEGISKLSKDGTLAEWTRTAINGLTYIMDAFEGLVVVVKSAGLIIGGIMAQTGEKFTSIATAIGQAVKGDFSGAMATMESSMRQQKVMQDDLRGAVDQTWSAETFGSKLRGRMEDLKNVGIASEATKPQLNVAAILAANEAATKAAAEANKLAEAAARAHAAELKKQEDAYIKLGSSIDQKIAEMTAETAAGVPLTAMQKMEIDFLAQLDNGTLKMTIDQRANIQAKLDAAKAAETLVIAHKEEQKQLAENTKENNAAIEAVQKHTEQLIDETEKQRSTNLEMIIGKDAMAALSVAKMYDTAATLERKAEVLDAGGVETDISAEFRAQAVALRTLADMKAEGVHIKAAVEARTEWEKTTKAIGDGLSSALTDALFEGRSLWDAFKNYLINTILDGAIKNALSSVIQAGLSSLSSGLSATLSSYFGAAAGNAAGGGSGGLFGAAASAASNAWSGVGSLFTGGGAGAGAISTGVAGGGAGAAVGTDLGLLGSGAGGAGAGAGAGAAGSSGLGGLGAAVLPLAAAATIFYFNDMFGNAARQATVMATAEQPQMADILTRWHETSDAGGEYQAIHSVTVQKLKFADNGEILYQLIGDGIPIETVDALKLGNDYGVTPFAAGGYHSGGLRLVGEYGPELEATGPSRIWSADQTASMMRGGGGGASNDEVVAELASMRRLLASIYRESKRTADATNGNGESPMITEVDA